MALRVVVQQREALGVISMKAGKASSLAACSSSCLSKKSAHAYPRSLQLLGIDISRQRFDSMHMLSNILQFTRTKLLGVSIKRLLFAIKRLCPNDCAALPTELRGRYDVPLGRLFGEASKSSEGLAHAQLQTALKIS